MNPLEKFIFKLENYWENEIELKRNEFLVHQNENNNNLYLVKKGSLRVFIEDEIEEHTIRFGYQNSIITALDSFLTDKPTLFYIQALKKCTLKVISKESYMQFIIFLADFKKNLINDNVFFSYQHNSFGCSFGLGQ